MWKLIGIIRIYSLVDLVLLLVASKAISLQFIGAILVWLAFLFFLEWKHRHSYRVVPPYLLWVLLALIGLILYPTVETLLFFACSYMYSLKINGRFGIISPVFGGLNRFFLIAGITGYAIALPWVVFVAILLRNLLGDVRDAGKDAKEGLKTFPVLVGLRTNVPYIHMYGVVGTTLLWWWFAHLNVVVLIIAVLIEVSTYNLTPRQTK